MSLKRPDFTSGARGLVWIELASLSHIEGVDLLRKSTAGCIPSKAEIEGSNPSGPVYYFEFRAYLEKQAYSKPVQKGFEFRKRNFSRGRSVISRKFVSRNQVG